MSLLPCLGETTDTMDWSDTQLWTFVVCTYLILLAFGLGMLLALQNLNEFVLSQRSTQRNKKVASCRHPMLTFYVWIVLDFASNIVYLIFNVRAA